MLPANPQLQRAAREILAGGVVAYPTEGVWGLGCLPGNRRAVERILQLKQRAPEKGLILVAAHIDQLAFVLQPLTAEQRRCLAHSWPGPVTWLVPHAGRVPPWVSGRFATAALRVSAHPTVRALCRLVGGPIVSTSANPQGKLPARFGFQVRRYFGTELVMAPGQVDRSGKASQIRDLQSGAILRE